MFDRPDSVLGRGSRTLALFGVEGQTSLAPHAPFRMAAEPLTYPGASGTLAPILEVS